MTTPTRRPPVTQEAAFAALDAYQAAHGREPTLDELRRAVGGNNQTVTLARQAWRDMRAVALAALEVPIPEAVRLCGHKLMEEAWTQARAAAEARFESDRRTLAEERDRLAQDARDAAALADQLAAELAQSVEDKRQLEEDAPLLAQKVVDLEREVAALKEEKARLQADLETATGKVQALTGPMAALQHQQSVDAARIAFLEAERDAARREEMAAREAAAGWRGQAEATRRQQDALLKALAPLQGAASAPGTPKARRPRNPATGDGGPVAG